MKNILSALILTGLASIATTPTAISQEAAVVEREAESYHQVGYFKYKNGSIDRAKEIVLIFKEADEDAGFDPVIDIWMLSGEWDHIAIFTLDDGPSELKYEITPNNAKFRKALAELVGGTDKAEALIKEFDSLVERSDKDLGFARY